MPVQSSRPRQLRSHYSRWKAMMGRCYRPSTNSYHCYGGRGIRVCREWHVFSVFQAWAEHTYQPGKQLDRINVNRGYSPKNCRWATASENAKGRRPQPEKVRRMQAAAYAALAAVYGDPRTRMKQWCPQCERWLKRDSFYCVLRRGKRVLHGWCKSCARARAKEREAFRARRGESTRGKSARKEINKQ